MNDRRTFLKGSLAVAGLGAAGCSLQQQDQKPVQAGIPNFKDGTRLLFQGDSITDMKWGRNQKDRNHYLGHSYVFLIASRLGVDMPQVKLEFFNRGISGNKVGDLRKRWQKDALDMNPDILSILVGVNDVKRAAGQTLDIAKWEEDYRYLLHESRKQKPDLKIVLVNPFVVRSGRLKDEDTYKFWRDQIDMQIPVVEKLVTEFGAAHIKMNEIFDQFSASAGAEHWIWDGVHPLPAGHELIARNWLIEVSKKFTF